MGLGGAKCLRDGWWNRATDRVFSAHQESMGFEPVRRGLGGEKTAVGNAKNAGWKRGASTGQHVDDNGPLARVGKARDQGASGNQPLVTDPVEGGLGIREVFEDIECRHDVESLGQSNGREIVRQDPMQAVAGLQGCFPVRLDAGDPCSGE
jgi:hypothetical protein